MSEQLKMTSSPGELLNKALIPGYDFKMENAVQGEFRAVNVPKLLTSFFMPSVESHQSKSFLFDLEEQKAQTLKGKSYSEVGPKFTQNTTRQLTFGIPSFGGAFSVNCKDYEGRRKPNSTEIMDEEYVIATQMLKLDQALDMLNELGIARLITADTNLTMGGPFPEYNYSQEFSGSARPAPTEIDFTSINDRQQFRVMIEEMIDEAESELAKQGKSASGWVLLSGKNVFNDVYSLEASVDNPRELKTAQDFASEGMPTLSVEGFSNYRAFSHSSGAMVVKYSANILTEKLIDDDAAYLVPVGVENMFSIELAPADSRETVNKVAEPMYIWFEEDRKGINFEFESNRLYFNRTPEAIRALRRV